MILKCVGRLLANIKWVLEYLMKYKMYLNMTILVIQRKYQRKWTWKSMDLIYATNVKMTRVVWIIIIDKDLQAVNKGSKWKSNKLIFEMLTKGTNVGVWNFSMYLQVWNVCIGVECEVTSIKTRGLRMNVKLNILSMLCYGNE